MPQCRAEVSTLRRRGVVGSAAAWPAWPRPTSLVGARIVRRVDRGGARGGRPGALRRRGRRGDRGLLPSRLPAGSRLRDLIARLGVADHLEWRRLPRPCSMAAGSIPSTRRSTFCASAAAVPVAGPARARVGGRPRARSRAAARDLRKVGEAGPRWFGRKGYEVLWRPLLEGKFGPYAPGCALAWLVGPDEAAGQCPKTRPGRSAGLPARRHRDVWPQALRDGARRARVFASPAAQGSSP